MLSKTLRLTLYQRSPISLSSASHLNWRIRHSSLDQMRHSQLVWINSRLSTWTAKQSPPRGVILKQVRHMEEHLNGTWLRLRGSEATLLKAKWYLSIWLPQRRRKGNRRTNLQVLLKLPLLVATRDNHSQAKTSTSLHSKIIRSWSDFHTEIRNMIDSIRRKTPSLRISQV